MKLKGEEEANEYASNKKHIFEYSENRPLSITPKGNHKPNTSEPSHHQYYVDENLKNQEREDEYDYSGAQLEH